MRFSAQLLPGLLLGLLAGLLGACHHAPPANCACRSEICTNKPWLQRWCGEGPDPDVVDRLAPFHENPTCRMQEPSATAAPSPTPSDSEQAYCRLLDAVGLQSERAVACPVEIRRRFGDAGCEMFRRLYRAEMIKRLSGALHKDELDLAGGSAKAGAGRSGSTSLACQPPPADSTGAQVREAYCRLVDAVHRAECPPELRKARRGDPCQLYRSRIGAHLRRALEESQGAPRIQPRSAPLPPLITAQLSPR